MCSPAFSLALAAIGIYGVMSYAVRLRMHEMGIRMVLGASAQDVLKIVMRHGLQLGVAGILSGVVLAGLLTRLMVSLLFEVKPLDGAAFAGGAAVLLAVIAASTFIPSRRAAKADPLKVLRSE